ncbi:MAG: helix-turn-helix transcriptional regulator [Myxococcales bacterium]
MPTSDVLAIVERCYEPELDTDSWAANLVETASRTLDLGAGLAFQLYEERGQRVRQKIVYGTGGLRSIHIGTPLLESMTGEAFRQWFYPRQPVAMASPILLKLPQYLQLAFKTAGATLGFKDFVGMLGYPSPGWIFGMTIGVGVDAEVPPALRATLHRIRIHVESGLRLRLQSAEEAAAVLSPDGALLHLEKAAAQEPTYEPLVHQAKTISRARTSRERFKEEALSAWTALADGRWSVVERIDSDGKRLYFAYENAPQARAYRALSPSEATVLDQSIRGLSGKQVAYATGLREARISEYLATAATKLGFRTRQELVRVASSMRFAGDHQLIDAGLTEAEWEVLRHVKDGLSNAEIARTRAASIRTVEHQVASILKKTGATGRRALIASDAGQD